MILTNKTVQENTDKQTQYKSEKVDNIEYSKTKLPWFSCLLQHYNKNKKQYMECLVVSYAKYSCCWWQCNLTLMIIADCIFFSNIHWHFSFYKWAIILIHKWTGTCSKQEAFTMQTTCRITFQCKKPSVKIRAGFKGRRQSGHLPSLPPQLRGLDKKNSKKIIT